MQYDQQEDTPMKYRKPEITTMASALESVQSMNAKVEFASGDGEIDYVVTPHAYEADE
jgi:hypothetical protein